MFVLILGFVLILFIVSHVDLEKKDWLLRAQVLVLILIS